MDNSKKENAQSNNQRAQGLDNAKEGAVAVETEETKVEKKVKLSKRGIFKAFFGKRRSAEPVGKAGAEEPVEKAGALTENEDEDNYSEKAKGWGLVMPYTREIKERVMTLERQMQSMGSAEEILTMIREYPVVKAQLENINNGLREIQQNPVQREDINEIRQDIYVLQRNGNLEIQEIQQRLDDLTMRVIEPAQIQELEGIIRELGQQSHLSSNEIRELREIFTDFRVNTITPVRFEEICHIVQNDRVRLGRMEGRLQEIERNFSQRILNMELGLEDFQQVIARLTADIAALSGANENLSLMFHRLLNRMNEMEQNMARQTQDFEDRHNVQNGVIVELQAERRQLQERMNHLEDHQNAQNGTISSLDAERGQLQERLNHLQNHQNAQNIGNTEPAFEPEIDDDAVYESQFDKNHTIFFKEQNERLLVSILKHTEANPEKRILSGKATGDFLRYHTQRHPNQMQDTIKNSHPASEAYVRRQGLFAQDNRVYEWQNVNRPQFNR